ncbi:hypothetical protein TrVGV298_009670 [Trichoderma virens]|nr:hypothetical protein TrVGV298_009670 [Trichoderma virens]
MGNHPKHITEWIRKHLFPYIEAGKQPDIRPARANDTLDDPEKWSASYLESGRFLGADDGRVWALTITKDAWDSLLKTCVVSEVDVSPMPSFGSIIMPQATTDEVPQAIREPISAASTLGLGPVVVISNSELASRSHGLHVSFGAVLCRDLESVEIYRGATVLCLRELDCPASRTMTEARFKVLDTGVETLSRNGELKLLDYDIGQGNKEDLSMRVTASSRDAVVYPPSTANSFPQGVHIWIGRDTASGDKLIGLSATNSPSFTVDKHQILHRRCSSTTIDADSGATQLHSIKDLWLLEVFYGVV